MFSCTSALGCLKLDGLDVCLGQLRQYLICPELRSANFPVPAVASDRACQVKDFNDEFKRLDKAPSLKFWRFCRSVAGTQIYP